MARPLEEKIEWAIKYLDSTNLSMSDIASMFGVSKKTVQNAMKELESLGKKYSDDGDEKYLPIYELSQLVQAKKTHNLIAGAKLGGHNGKPASNGKNNGGRKLTISEENIKKYATMMANGELSFRELEHITGVPKSTLYDNKERMQQALEQPVPSDMKKGKK